MDPCSTFRHRRAPLVHPLVALLALSSARAGDGDPSSGEPVADDPLVVQAPAGPNPIHVAGTLTVRELGPGGPPATDLARVLQSVPGANVRRLGGLGDSAVVSLRGSSLRQVEVFLDGVPLNPDGAEVVDLSELPPSAFSRVEVWRGDAPASYGAAPLGGVVDLRTPAQGDVTPAVGAAAGSWGTVRGWAVGGGTLGGARLGEWAPRAFLTGETLATAGDFTYLDDAGTLYNRFDDRLPRRRNNDVFRASALGRVVAGPRTARVTLLDSVAHLDRGLPGPVGARADAARYAATRNLLSLGAELSPGATVQLAPRAWWLSRVDALDDRQGELGVGTTWRRDTSGTLGAQLDARWTPSRHLQATALLRARRDGYAPYDVLTRTDAGGRRRLATTGAVSADVRAWEDRVLVAPTVQALVLDDRLLGAEPFTGAPVPAAESAVSAYVMPRAGVLVRPLGTLALKANAGRYVRPPDLFELFGARGGEVGNADLRPETGVSWDLGLRGVHALGERPGRAAWACVALDAALSEVHATDRIVRVQNSQRTTIPVNVPAARIRTLEAGLELDVRGVIRSRSSATWNDARNLDPDPAYADNALPRLPAFEGEQRTALGWRDRVELAHTWSRASGTFLDAANILSTGPRSLHGVSLLARARSGLGVSAEVLNLLDVRATAVDRNPLSDTDDTLVAQPLADFAGYPLPGRTVMVAVSWQPTSPRESP